MDREVGAVPAGPSWNARLALEGRAAQQWHGYVWRTRGLNLSETIKAGALIFYDAVSDGGSRCRSGRYHRATDRFRTGPIWPVIYTSLSDGTAIGEVTRHAGRIEDLEFMRITRMRVELSAVLDLRDPTQLGLTLDDVTADPVGPDDLDAYRPSQEIGLVALERQAEGILVPSATRLNANLVIFTTNLLPASIIEPLEDFDLRLYVRRS